MRSDCRNLTENIKKSDSKQCDYSGKNNDNLVPDFQVLKVRHLFLLSGNSNIEISDIVAVISLSEEIKSPPGVYDLKKLAMVSTSAQQSIKDIRFAHQEGNKPTPSNALKIIFLLPVFLSVRYFVQLPCYTSVLHVYHYSDKHAI